LSPSLVVDRHSRRETDDRAALAWTDIALAVVLHLALAAALLAAGKWPRPHPFHPHVVTVHLIAPAPTMRRHHQALAPHRPAVKPVAKPKPKAIRKPIRKPKAVSKPKAARPRIAPSKPRAKQPDVPFDPFKPLESPEDIHPAQPAALPSTETMIRRQLSGQEINRYIARIQAAVQAHWKVPALTHHERDPLVLMRLNPDGSVRDVTILESSGNPALDASLKRAIHAAAPFTLPRAQFEVFRENRIRFHPLR